MLASALEANWKPDCVVATPENVRATGDSRVIFLCMYTQTCSFCLRVHVCNCDLLFLHLLRFSPSLQEDIVVSLLPNNTPIKIIADNLASPLMQQPRLERIIAFGPPQRRPLPTIPLRSVVICSQDPRNMGWCENYKNNE